MRRRVLIASSLIVALATCAGWLAQTRLRAAQQPTSDFSAVANEIRLLRVAVENATRAQTQTQGLSVYLSAHQSRFVQTASRLDGIRRELDAASESVQNLIERLAESQQALPRATAEFRNELEGHIADLKRQLTVATTTEQRLRARETTLLQDFQQDEATWRDLIARLEQSIKR